MLAFDIIGISAYFPVQETCAEGFKRALIDLDKQLYGYDARIVHILHDEIIVEAREDIANDVAVMVKGGW